MPLNGPGLVLSPEFILALRERVDWDRRVADNNLRAAACATVTRDGRMFP